MIVILCYLNPIGLWNSIKNLLINVIGVNQSKGLIIGNMHYIFLYSL